MALTDAVARQARTTGKAYTLNDSDGLSLFVTANGAKKWHFRFSLQGKQQRISLGSYPEFSLKQARQQRDELRMQLAGGIDPRNYRQQSNTAAQSTFDAVFRQWRDFKALSLESGRQSTLSQIDRIFAKDVLPSLGGLSIFDVEPSYILAVLRRIERHKAFTTAEKVRTWLNQLFRYAKVEKGVHYNPASDLDIVAAPRPPVTHNPFLRMDELPAFLCTLRDYGGQETTKQGLRLLLLTGVRTGELRLAEPDQFDLKRGLWIIPPASVKQLQVRMRREGNSVPAYVVPLPRQAIDIVKALLTLQKRRPAQRYLLPNCNNLQKRISENTLNSALKRMGYADRLTGHGIRATISTALNELGYPKEWIEVQLSHADPNKIRAAYNHASYVEQRRMMMQEWADRLDRWEGGEAVTKSAATRGIDAFGMAANSRIWPAEGAPLLREVILR
ncbi:tyrosine-type recombinase/integrase [Symbiopectobacterium purcellii]|uniref:Tyrosine-type recombinase/integrase n=1 Tax=Symbiopectobacterium purcellii TaxID=2871826 RepID=A0ABX9ATM1_9ENTR|nr:tyrosine-type recombinase/integrase [Symbiopectobacterium purcellii]